MDMHPKAQGGYQDHLYRLRYAKEKKSGGIAERNETHCYCSLHRLPIGSVLYRQGLPTVLRDLPEIAVL
jgi:hypothetical protein